MYENAYHGPTDYPPPYVRQWIADQQREDDDDD